MKAEATLDIVAIGYTGTATSPSTLVLAFPGDVDDGGAPRTAGSTTVLTKAVARLQRARPDLDVADLDG